MKFRFRVSSKGVGVYGTRKRTGNGYQLMLPRPLELPKAPAEMSGQDWVDLLTPAIDEARPPAERTLKAS